jgi:hypothetical protein
MTASASFQILYGFAMYYVLALFFCARASA